MAGIVIPVSLTTDETKKQRDDLRDLGNWIWDIFGNEIEEKNLLQ